MERFKWLWFVLGGWLLLSFFFGLLGYDTKITYTEEEIEEQLLQERIAEQRALANMPRVTAEELATAYDENAIAADAKFKNVQFRVSGIVEDIRNDALDRPYLILDGGVNRFLNPQFNFDREKTEDLLVVKKGSKITLVCTGNGDIATRPISKNCRVLQYF